MKIEIKILNKNFYKLHETPMDDDKDFGHDYLPSYATFGSAAVDLVTTEDVVLYPGETKMIPTGLAIWIGSDSSPFALFNIAGLVLPRSGLGTKGLVLANTVGLIDSDYQGELKISAWNRNNEYNTVDKQSHEGDWQDIEWNTKDIIELKAGDRIAQLLFIPVLKAEWDVVEEFSNVTERGGNGFGSSGT